MPERVTPGPVNGSCNSFQEAVCIHTKKIFDSCKDKDCIEDLRVYLTRSSQEIVERAQSVRGGTAELLTAYIDVEPIPFNRGFYTVDVKYFYKVTAEAFAGAGRPREICGLATYDKRTVLFGSEGSVRIFSSHYLPQENDLQNFEKTNLPIAVVEVVDPVALGIKVTDGCDCGECALNDIPDNICHCFDDDIVICDEGKKLFVTLGQFSIIKLERDIQLLMPAYDICMPEKDCSGSTGGAADDPCDLFQRFKFPVDEFFPPKYSDYMKTNGSNSNNNGNNNSCSCNRR